jgi:hypothetical protein
MNSETIGKYAWRGIIAAAIVVGLYFYFFPGDVRKTEWYQCYERRKNALHLPHELDQDNDTIISILVWCDEQLSAPPARQGAWSGPAFFATGLAAVSYPAFSGLVQQVLPAPFSTPLV